MRLDALRMTMQRRTQRKQLMSYGVSTSRDFCKRHLQMHNAWASYDRPRHGAICSTERRLLPATQGAIIGGAQYTNRVKVRHDAIGDGRWSCFCQVAS